MDSLVRTAGRAYPGTMATPEDMESRLSAVEREVARLRETASLAATDAGAARVLAAGADHDVSEVRAELRAHTSALNALRQTQLEQGRRLDGMDRRFDGMDRRFDGMDRRFDSMDLRFDGLETRMTDGFATVGAGMAQIVTLLEGLDDR